MAGAVASTYSDQRDYSQGRGSARAAHRAVFGSEDLFHTSDLIARQPTRSQLAAFAADVADLKPGDFVVHVTHGVGRFVGMREIVQGDQKGDFMLLEYAGERSSTCR